MFLEATSKPYVDFSYYQDSYLGKEITEETEFNRLVKRVTPTLDLITFGRVRKLEEIPECVKEAMCAMCESYAGLEVSGADRKVTSENNDGFSQSFKEYDETSIRTQVIQAGKAYLMMSGLLYKGVLPIDKQR